MEIDKVFKLIDAGFTKDEILKLTEEPAAEEPAQEEAPVASQAEEKPAEAPAQQPAYDALLEEIKGMREDLRKRALLDDGFRPQDSRAAAEEVLASIINPPLQSKMKGKKD